MLHELYCFLFDQASSIHMAQIRWMLDLLVLMIPDYSEDQSSEQDHHSMTNVSLKTLDEDAKLLIEKLDYFSRYITRYQRAFPVISTYIEAMLFTRVNNY